MLASDGDACPFAHWRDDLARSAEAIEIGTRKLFPPLDRSMTSLVAMALFCSCTVYDMIIYMYM